MWRALPTDYVPNRVRPNLPEDDKFSSVRKGLPFRSFLTLKFLFFGGMFSSIHSVHFVGICGTAMASAAAAMRENGVRITGSDQNVYPPMSTFLAERKIEVISGYA